MKISPFLLLAGRRLQLHALAADYATIMLISQRGVIFDRAAKHNALADREYTAHDIM